jgi:lipid-binding SYLF domain-containing protein
MNNPLKTITLMLISVVMQLFLIVLLVPNLCAGGMQDDIDQAANILNSFRKIPEKSIPHNILNTAKGLAIITVTKAGFIVSGRGGTGIVIARTENGWSGPSAIGSGGIGVGFQAGAQISELVIVLNTPKAVQAFSKQGNVSLGGDLSVAAGPVGRNVAADMLPQAAVYTYSRSQGLFAGISLEGTVIATRDDANAVYYGREVNAADILAGKVKPPSSAQKLLQELSRFSKKNRQYTK